MAENTQPAYERGYEVNVVILRVERINNTASGNPRYRFHTDTGIYTTADDIQASSTINGDETGPAALRIEDSRIIAWRIPA